MDKQVLSSSYVSSVRDKYPGYTFDTLQYVVDCFRQLDKDRSGTVNRSELGGVLEGLGVEATPGQVEAFLNECDTNGDGQIEQSEFVAVLYRRMVSAARRKCCGERRVWMMENPGKVLCAKRTISIIMGLVQVILAIISFATFQSSQGNVKGMISTWNLVPIADVQWVTPGSACPSGYTAFDGYPTAPGEPDKCDCSHDCSQTVVSRRCTGQELSEGCKDKSHSCTTSSSGVTTCLFDCDCDNRNCITVGSVCNSTQIARSCTSVPGYPPTPLKQWRNKEMCYKRAGLSAVQREEASGSSATCSAGNTQTCGAAGSNATIACFPTGIDCPVTSVSVATVSPFTTNLGRDVGASLPTTLMQMAIRQTSPATSPYSSERKNTSSEYFMPSDFTAYDTQSMADVYVDNGIAAKFATAHTYAQGFQSEIAWDNDCSADRKNLVDMTPALDKLGLMLQLMLVFVIIDFIWSMVELFTISQSKALKWLTLRTVCDIGCYGANLPIILIAMGAAAVVQRVTGDISGCAPTAELRNSFDEVSKRAGTIAGTNLVLLIFKGVKMLFMSALFQFGIWMCMRSMCGKKRAKGTLNLALSDGDAATYKAENPMQRA